MGKRSVDDLILVTGSGGLVGSALKRLLGPTAIFLDRASGDLRDPNTVKNLFERYKPKKVIHLAAVVGGVKSNSKYPADYYFDNVMINTNVLNSARAVGTQKILSYMSTCVFPDDASYPLTVDQLHNGEPHHSNFGYAYAKRMDTFYQP
jgi:GDP-L-fucose synthase